MAIKNFYGTLLSNLRDCGLEKPDFKRIAHDFLSKKFFEKHVYTKALGKLRHSLKNKSNIVVLLSGSMQELIDPFFTQLCKVLKRETQNNGENWDGRFFARGTEIIEESKSLCVNLCVGSNKIEFLRRLLKEKGHEGCVLKFVYSDNSFMADLPLLIESEHGGAVISNKTNGYKVLSKNILDKLFFFPNWGLLP